MGLPSLEERLALVKEGCTIRWHVVHIHELVACRLQVRAVGVSKQSVMDRIVMGALLPHDDGDGHEPGNSTGSAGRGARERSPPVFPKPVDFVLCVGHFLGRDEDVSLSVRVPRQRSLSSCTSIRLAVLD
jgi:hypothetical protein